MWIGFYYQMISMTMVEIDASKDPGLIDVEGKLHERVTTLLNKKASPCKKYNSDDTNFNTCCQKVFTDFLRNNGSCTAPGLKF